MAQLIGRCETAISKDPKTDSFLETLIEQALLNQVGVVLPGADGLVSGRKDATFPHWAGRLKDVDVKLRLPGEQIPSILIEAKVEEVGQTIWDLLKLAEIPFLKGAVAGYLVVAATERHWMRRGDCVPLFDENPEEDPWLTRRFFRRWQRAWLELKGGGSGRPVVAPREVATRFIESTPVLAFPGYELRCVRVLPLGPPALQFQDGDPI